MADIDGYGEVRPEWLKALALRAQPRSLEALEADGAGDGRAAHPPRGPRVRTLIRAVIDLDGHDRQDVIVRDVSPGGMCIASRTVRPRCGETVRVALPGQGDLQAQVRWVGDGEFGIQLMDGLDVDALQSINRRRNAGFIAALERLLRVGAHKDRNACGMRPC